MPKANKPPQQNILFTFIDAANLWEAQKTKGKLLDFDKLKAYIRAFFAADEVSIFYYTAYPKDGTRSYSIDGRHRFYTYLKKDLGFIVRKKELKRIVAPSTFADGMIEKGNMDVEITIDAVENINRYSTAVFFTGDSDFLALVNHLKAHGKDVVVISSRSNVSQEMRSAGNGYSDILKIKDDIWGRELHRREGDKI